MIIFAQDSNGFNIGEAYNAPDFTLGDLVSLVLSGGITIAGIILIFLVIFAGYNIIAGAGSNDPKATAQGKAALTYALIGFVIVMSTYLILTLIEAIVGVNFITLPGTLSGDGSGPPPGGGPF